MQRVICSINALHYDANKRILTRCSELKIMHRKYITLFFESYSFSFFFFVFRFRGYSMSLYIVGLIGESLRNGGEVQRRIDLEISSFTDWKINFQLREFL